MAALQLLEHDGDKSRAVGDGVMLALGAGICHLGRRMHRMPLGRRRDERPPNSTSGIRRVEAQLLGHADLVADHGLELKRIQLGGPLGLQQTHSLCVEVIWQLRRFVARLLRRKRLYHGADPAASKDAVFDELTSLPTLKQGVVDESSQS